MKKRVPSASLHRRRYSKSTVCAATAARTRGPHPCRRDAWGRIISPTPCNASAHGITAAHGHGADLWLSFRQRARDAWHAWAGSLASSRKGQRTTTSGDSMNRSNRIRRTRQGTLVALLLPLAIATAFASAAAASAPQAIGPASVNEALFKAMHW